MHHWGPQEDFSGWSRPSSAPHLERRERDHYDARRGRDMDPGADRSMAVRSFAALGIDNASSEPRGPATADKALAEALCDDIVRVGPKTVFALQGDYNIAFVKAAHEHKHLNLIHVASDSEVGLMADGYGRVHSSRLGVCSCTHNTGSLFALGGVAGAEAERQSVIYIGGCPNPQAYARGLLQHHVYEVSDTSQSRRAFAATCYSAQHARTATEGRDQVNSALRTCPLTRHSAFVEVPINLWHVKVPHAAVPPAGPQPENAPLDPVLGGWLASVVDLVRASSGGRFLMIVGRDVDTFGCHREVKRLAEAMNCAVATTMCGKTAFENTDPRWVGTYWGAASTELCLEVLRTCDLCFVIGVLPFDYGSAGFTEGVHSAKRVRLDARAATTPTHTVGAMNAALFRSAIGALASLRLGAPSGASGLGRLGSAFPAPVSAAPGAAKLPITAGAEGVSFAELSGCISAAMHKNPDPEDYFFETGTSWWVAREMKCRPNVRVHVQILYGMLGWALHAATGAAAALVDENKRGRTIAVFGDGAFQILASGVHSACKYELPVTYIILDNGFYGVENGIAPGKINELVDWDYAAIVRGMAGKGAAERITVHENVDTAAKLQHALEDAQTKLRQPVFIHVRLSRKDYSPATLKTWAKGVIKTNSYPAPPEFDSFGNVWGRP